MNYKRKWHSLYIFLLMIFFPLTACGSSGPITSSQGAGSSSGSQTSLTSGETSSQETTPTDVDFETLVIHFRGDGLVLADWSLWLWEDGGDGALFLFNEPNDDYGAVARYPASTWTTRSKLNYISRKTATWVGQSTNNSIRYDMFKDEITNDGELHVYLIHLEREVFVRKEDALGDRVLKAYFTDWKKVQFETTAAFHSYELLANDLPIKSGNAGSSGQQITLDTDADLSVLYQVKVRFKADEEKYKFRGVSATNLFETTKFLTDYTYNGKDLGVTYTPTASTFKLWAPSTSKVELRVYLLGTPGSISGSTLTDVMVGRYNMVRQAGGVFSVSVTGDLHGKYYTYMVTNSEGTNEVVDPYAKSAGVNGMRGQIVDFSKTNPEGWDDVTFTDIQSANDLIIYEMHVRDLTIDESWNGTEANRGKYLGMVESGTTYTKGEVTVSTGFDHLKELGINAIQIMPFYDQANNELADTYNWGYNPLNYNVLEGQYSSNPFDGLARVKEFKEAVKAFAEADIRIIMDVVYNHVSSATGSNFDLIVPGYYFRLNPNGTYNDDAGVGNVVKSERKMMSKFIVESMEFWASEYNIKGFRFDLMDLIDTTTLNNSRTAMNAIDSDIVIYGEPWSAVGGNSGRVYGELNGIGGFNDQGRNGIRGENNWNNRWGWMQKGENDNSGNNANLYLNKVKGMMAGMAGNYYEYMQWDPAKTVNYASCHDNLTLYDQLLYTVDNGDAPKASVAVNALITFGIGIPFINGGEEIMRTKIAAEDDLPETYYTASDGTKISHNSYRSPDSVNSYKWENKVDYKEYNDRYADMISLRKQYSNFNITSRDLVGRQYEGYPDKHMGFFDLPTSFSTIAAWYQNASDILYVFANARESVQSGTVTSQIGWGGSSDHVEVLFDSSGRYSVGTRLSASVMMDPYQVLLVKRL
ncbi:MAG TPA: type I pullulanase [Bacilli bacterium]|nr:type I pullulanase [Bacilli bacterium]